jgi:hypothetical protein
MPETVNIEVYCDAGEDGPEPFGVVSQHRPELPKPFDAELQNWVKANFSHLSKGDSVEQAGEMVYEPNGEIIEFRKKND